MKHLSDLELNVILNRTDYPAEDSPRDALEAHLETCQECCRRLGEMRQFHEDMEADLYYHEEPCKMCGDPSDNGICSSCYEAEKNL